MSLSLICAMVVVGIAIVIVGLYDVARWTLGVCWNLVKFITRIVWYILSNTIRIVWYILTGFVRIALFGLISRKAKPVVLHPVNDKWHTLTGNMDMPYKEHWIIHQ
jgi:hypothetical protein